MSYRRHALLIAATASLAACSSPPPAADMGNDSPPIGSMGAPNAPVAENQSLPAEAPAGNAATPANAAAVEADYIGKWIGVEGMVLDVAANPKGGVRITNQWDLDHKGSFDGSVTAEGLRFMRNGEAVTAYRGDGDATGLKYLAGKKDCLIVKSGEGYCRD